MPGEQSIRSRPLAYHIEILERDWAFWAFLAACNDIPDDARLAILERSEEGLANISDEARGDPADRVSPNCFRYLYVFRGKEGKGCTLRFIVDDSRRVYNVLRVLYVDAIVAKPLHRLETPISEA